MDGVTRVVLPEPGRSWWTGGVRHDGMFFPRWVMAVCVAVAVVLVPIGLIADGVTPMRVLFALGVMVPFGCDAAMLVWTELAERIESSRLTLVLVPQIVGLASILLLARHSDNPASILLVFLIGAWATTLRIDKAAGLFGLAVLGVLLHMRAPALADKDSAHAWASWLIGMVFAFICGVVFQRQVRLITQLREAQASLAGKAATEERQRIAREVHDVIAHSLTVTMLHLTGARLTLEHDPTATGEAISALEEAERLGRESLHDIRRTVGLLTTGGGDSPAAPAPAAEDLRALVEEFSRAGQVVTLSVNGELGRLSLPAGLALYRIIQESLTNAAKHAPGAAADVTVTVGDDDVELCVVNPASPPRPPERTGGGHGLIGMSQRAGLLGGQVEAGYADGRWTVRGSLPRTMALDRTGSQLLSELSGG
jgi:signal transduction histidine kinase